MTLKSGREADVLTVIRGVDVLRSKTELQILELGPTMMAAIGADWMNLYYEATVQLLHNSQVITVTPRDVESTRLID